MLSCLWQALSQEGERAGGAGPSQEAILARRGMGRGWVWAGAGLGGLGGFSGGEGTWRYVDITGIWTDPKRTVRSKERAHGPKSWRKRDPPGEKETSVI